MEHKVLFVCTGNTCRSPMAEALLKEMLKEKGLDKSFKVISAGIAAFSGEAASNEAILAMEEQGIDIKEHQAEMITKKLIAASDLIITMTVKHKETILSLMPESLDKVYTLKELAANENSLLVLAELQKIDKEATMALLKFRQDTSEEEEMLSKRKAELWAQLQEVDKRLRDLTGKKESLLSEYIKKKQDLIDKEKLSLDVQDPFGKSLEVYKETSKELWENISKALDKILEVKGQEKQ